MKQECAYLPPSSVLNEALGIDLATVENGSRVEVPASLLKLLIKAVLMNVPFDEEYYREHNSDLDEAWRSGKIVDLRKHFIETGYFEGRMPSDGKVDPGWYLVQYKDVALAIREGRARSAEEHYRTVGEREWRSPNEALAAEVLRWHRALLDTR
jgi:hypothetical protein